MRRCYPPLLPCRRRSGKVLVMFALMLPVLLGMVGLAIDCGLLITAHREAQNAADAAAMAAAMAKLTDASADYQAAANAFAPYYGLSSIPVTNPPGSGPHSGSNRYFEA